VSRVLNGDVQNVSDATRQRVLESIRQLNYRAPAEIHRPSAGTGILSVLIPDILPRPLSDVANGYFAGVFDGVLEEAARQQYATLVQVEAFWPEPSTAVRKAYDGRCDGVIFIGSDLSNGTIQTLWERGIPIVTVGSDMNLPSVSVVDIENVGSARHAAETLADMGHRHIVYFGPHFEITSSFQRASGYALGLLDRGMAPSDVRCYLTRSTVDSDCPLDHGVAPIDIPAVKEATLRRGHRWISDLLDAAYRDGAPDAIICWNTNFGEDLLLELRRREVAVPADVSVWAFDDPPYACQTDPPLTTFDQPLYEIGRSAVQALIRRIKDPNAEAMSVLFTPRPVMRESTAPRTCPDRGHLQ
jgi:LacI family transcriptional regulator